MPKKLIVVTLIASLPLTALAADQTDSTVDSLADKQSASIKAKTPQQPATELEPVIVTSPLPTKLSKTTVPVTVLKGDELTMKMGHTIGETLKQELGITSQSFGPGVGTPVIRGQSGPRVRVLQNGIGSNDVSQLSPDHATSIEPSMAERIEVLRGPATLLYGSGAMGGVVNIIDNRIPTHLYSKPVNLVFDQRYDSAFNESSTAMKSEGSEGHWAYHLDGLYRDRGDMAIGGTAIDANKAQALDPTLNVVSNTHGVIPNTFAQTLNGSIGGSYVGDGGFVGVAVNQFHNNYGIAPDGGSLTQNGLTYADPNTRIDQMQTKYDFKSELNNPFSFADKLSMRLGYTDYYHTEWDGGVPGIPYSPGTAFSNKTYEGRVELTHKPIGPFKGAVGFQAISSQFNAFDFPLGGVPQTAWPTTDMTLTNIVPATQTNSFGVFGLESFEHGPVNYQLGLRVEDTALTPSLSNSYTAPYILAPDSTSSYGVASSYNFLPISASASALWNLDEMNSLNMALTRSQRAPQVQELFANGYHDATRSYELGDPNLQMETSYNLDLGYKYKTDWMRAELDIFNNWANNYIYQKRTGEFVPPGFEPLAGQTLAGANQTCATGQAGGTCTPVTASYQAGAIFRGYEAKMVFPIAEPAHGALDLTLFSDYTNGTFVATGGAVPRMPPLRFGFQWDYTHKEWSGNLRFTRAQAQEHPGANDTTTAGYYLLTVGGQYHLQTFHDANIMLFIKGNNLLNENIRNSVSYLRNFAPEPGRGAELGIRISY
ncbi:MAG: TonB-dependent receptor [Methylococcales bacterium]|nr:TonB-dependent receptor [Methylococcales bacterium]